MLEYIQWKFAALCQYRFFAHDRGTYEDFLKFLNLYTLHNRRLYLDVLFLISVHSCLKCCHYWYSSSSF
jgi:Tat protein secretion system quality control protein TatD with DNase activity